jgi:hypothetical protein
MRPIHGERGKQYWAIKCANPECAEKMLLIESSVFDSEGAVRERFRSESVRCDMCARETSIIKSLLFINHVI